MSFILLIFGFKDKRNKRENHSLPMTFNFMHPYPSGPMDKSVPKSDHLSEVHFLAS